MNKKFKIVLSLVILLAVAVGGFLYFLKNQEKIVDLGNGWKSYENKILGVTVKIDNKTEIGKEKFKFYAMPGNYVSFYEKNEALNKFGKVIAMNRHWSNAEFPDSSDRKLENIHEKECFVIREVAEVNDQDVEYFNKEFIYKTDLYGYDAYIIQFEADDLEWGLESEERKKRDREFLAKRIIVLIPNKKNDINIAIDIEVPQGLFQLPIDERNKKYDEIVHELILDIDF